MPPPIARRERLAAAVDPAHALGAVPDVARRLGRDRDDVARGVAAHEQAPSASRARAKSAHQLAALAMASTATAPITGQFGRAPSVWRRPESLMSSAPALPARR